MATCLGKSYSYGLLCVPFVNVCVCFFPYWFSYNRNYTKIEAKDLMNRLRVDVDLMVYVPDHCFSYNSTCNNIYA